ncbi:MAG: hypothetical protein LBE59_04750 [Nevskiaceae bacterium]|jgi:uncharacterized membrane protein SirB2|nr:hypothetical protein [Nevskiaceae bacterium]
MDLLIALGQTPISLMMANSAWVVPTMQSIHIICVTIASMSVLIICLRVLGVAWQGVSLRQTVARFAPWAWVALILLTLTGIVLIFAEPPREIMALSMWIKMALLAVLIAVAVRFLRLVRNSPAFAAPEVNPDGALRRRAVFTLCLVVAIIFLGRFIAYDALIWGRLSPVGQF